MASGIYELIDKIPVSKRKIVREGGKWKIYLPSSYNELWQHLHEEGVEVDLIIFIKR